MKSVLKKRREIDSTQSCDAVDLVSLAEFMSGTGGQDFNDVSLVDGYNLPMIMECTGGSSLCATTGCTSDLKQQCPTELRASEGSACKSVCEAFGSPEYYCSGA